MIPRITSWPWCSSGMNGIGGHGMTFAIAESDSGAASAAAMNPATVSGVAGRTSSPPATWSSGWSRYWNRVATPKLPPPPRMAQKRSWCVVGVGADALAVGGHDLGGEQRIDGQAVGADEVADAAAERDPADARPIRCRRTRSASPCAAAAAVNSAAVSAGLGPGGPRLDDRSRARACRAGRGRCRRR